MTKWKKLTTNPALEQEYATALANSNLRGLCPAFQSSNSMEDCYSPGAEKCIEEKCSTCLKSYKNWVFFIK